MKLVFINSSIECSSANVISRDIRRSSFMEIKTIGKCCTYKCKRNSEASVLKELTPKIAIHNKKSLLSLEDKIECQDLYFATTEKKSLKPNVIPHTGTHKAQQIKTNGYTYAEISRPVPNIPSAKIFELGNNLFKNIGSGRI